MKPDERKLAAQYAEGCPGAAIGLDLEATAKLHRDALTILERAVELRGVSDLFASTAALAKSQEIAFENVLEVFYSLLTDLLDLSSSSTKKVLRNPALRRELETLSKKVDVAWISKAVDGFDVLHARTATEHQSVIGTGRSGHFPGPPRAGHKKIYFSVTEAYPDSSMVHHSVVRNLTLRPWNFIIRRSCHRESQAVSPYSDGNEGTAYQFEPASSTSGPQPHKKPAPPEQTHAENFYWIKQMQARTPVVIVLTDGETLHGTIEWYDRDCIKLTRTGSPNLADL